MVQFEAPLPSYLTYTPYTRANMLSPLASPQQTFHLDGEKNPAAGGKEPLTINYTETLGWEKGDPRISAMNLLIAVATTPETIVAMARAHQDKEKTKGMSVEDVVLQAITSDIDKSAVLDHFTPVLSPTSIGLVFKHFNLPNNRLQLISSIAGVPPKNTKQAQEREHALQTLNTYFSLGPQLILGSMLNLHQMRSTFEWVQKEKLAQGGKYDLVTHNPQADTAFSALFHTIQGYLSQFEQAMQVIDTNVTPLSDETLKDLLLSEMKTSFGFIDTLYGNSVEAGKAHHTRRLFQLQKFPMVSLAPADAVTGNLTQDTFKLFATFPTFFAPKTQQVELIDGTTVPIGGAGECPIIRHNVQPGNKASE